MSEEKSTESKPRFVSMEEPAVKIDERPDAAKEIGGRKQGLEPTRYGDWEFKGRCIDF